VACGGTVGLGTVVLIYDGVAGNFHQHNSSWGGKGSWCIGLTILPLSSADCHEIWEPQPPRTLMACQGIALPL
jgi:hypothetical protein